MLALINQSLPHELLNILNILFINNLGKDSEGISFEHIVISQLDIFGQTGNDHKHFIFIHIKLLDEHVNQPSNVLV